MDGLPNPPVALQSASKSDLGLDAELSGVRVAAATAGFWLLEFSASGLTIPPSVLAIADEVIE
jgi:hypothetical protein